MFEEKFKSRKNDVYKRVRETDGEARFVVEKEFSEAKRFYMEYVLHDILAKGGLTVPRLLDFKAPEEDFNGKLIYEFLEGDLIIDILQDKGVAEEAMLKIIDWMEGFYRVTSQGSGGEQWALGDAHLRNFIYNRDRQIVYGFDFEESEKGGKERDIAKLFLYIATYEPAYSERHMELAEYFLRESLKKFEYDKNSLLAEISNEAERMEKRRQVDIKSELVIPVLQRVIV